MRIGDLGSSFAFALPLEVQSLTFTRSQGHGRGEGLESVLLGHFLATLNM